MLCRANVSPNPDRLHPAHTAEAANPDHCTGELRSISLAPSRRTHYFRPTVKRPMVAVEAAELPRDRRGLTTEMSYDLFTGRRPTPTPDFC